MLLAYHHLPYMAIGTIHPYIYIYRYSDIYIYICIYIYYIYTHVIHIDYIHTQVRSIHVSNVSGFGGQARETSMGHRRCFVRVSTSCSVKFRVSDATKYLWDTFGNSNIQQLSMANQHFFYGGISIIYKGAMFINFPCLSWIAKGYTLQVLSMRDAK